MNYKFLDDLTSDIMFEAYGKTPEELFSNAAEAMFSVICQLDKVSGKESRGVSLEADSIDKLMVGWLQELISMVDTEEMFFSRFVVDSVKEEKGKWQLKAKVYGEPVTPEKGETVVKAVTNYGFKLEKTMHGYLVRVSVDI